MQRGEFDRLPGAGKPLVWEDDAHIPPDWQLAFKMLKDAGCAPEWIEQDKEIRAERDALARWLEQQTRWQREQVAALATRAPADARAVREHLARARERVRADYRARATALNRAIDAFNLQVPVVRLQHARIRIEEELERLDAACC